MEVPGTALGIDENIEAMLCYVLGWLSGFVFLLLEKDNNFVRFHAMQSLTVFLSLFVLSMAVRWVPIIGGLISFLLFPVMVVLWIVLMVKAFQGEKYKLPWAGDFSEEQIA